MDFSMRSPHLTGLLLLSLLGASCGRDPLLETPQSVGDGGGRGGAGGAPLDGGRGGSGGGLGGAGGVGDASPPDVLPGQFSLVLLPAEGPPIPVGRTYRLRALVRLDDGWRDLGTDPQITWQSDQPAIASVATGNGRVAGVKAGKTIVRATHPLFGVAQAAVTVTGSSIARLAITPSPADVPVSQTRQLSAQAMYDDGSSATVTDAAIWTSADQRTVRVQGSLPPIGELTGVLAGTVDVMADFAGASAIVKVTVGDSGMTMLTIAPPSVSLMVGSTTRFQALLRQPSGAATDVSNLAAWSSSNTAVARSVGGGQVRCASPGTCTINVSHAGRTAAAALQCTPAGTVTLKELRILPAGANGPLFVMAKYGLMLEGTNSDGSPANIPTSQITWTSSDEATASIDGGGVIIGHVPGTVDVTAGFGGLSASETYTFIAR
jgi:uncharacterized protein YjdB